MPQTITISAKEYEELKVNAGNYEYLLDNSDFRQFMYDYGLWVDEEEDE